MTARPVALVHGWGGSFEGTFGRMGWREAFCAVGRAVLPIDMPGHGAGTKSHVPEDYRDMAAAVDRLLPQGDREIDILGFSLGGKLALELACRRPERFRRIAVCGVGDGAFRQTTTRLADILEKEFSVKDRADMPAIASYLDESRNDYLALAAVLRRPRSLIASEERLRAIRSDIAIINGDEDAIAIPDARLRAALPAARYFRLPCVDHFRMHHAPSFVETAIAFMAANS
jgi:pimeloyl-ACP methyl ester carboxylesterase